MDITLLDKNFEVYGSPIDTFSALTYTDRWSADGDFKLILPVGKYNDVKDAAYVYVDGRTFEISDIKTKDRDANNQLTLSGHSLNVLLDRVVITEPERIQGNLEVEIRALVNEYCGQGFQAINKFAFETLNGYGRAIDANALRGSLADFLYTELNARGFSFELNYDITNDQIVFSIVHGLDRTQDQTVNAPAVFSASQGNIENMEYERNENEYYNCAVVCDEDPDNPQTAVVDLSNGAPKRTIYVNGSSAYDDTETDALYVMVASGGYIATSTDGQAWTSRTSGTAQSIYSINYQNGIYIAGLSNGSILTSVDAITWSAEKPTGSAYSIEGVGYHDGMYFAFAFDSAPPGGGEIWYSYDTVTWVKSEDVPYKIVNAIQVDNGFIALLSYKDNYYIYRSEDGTVWDGAAVPMSLSAVGSAVLKTCKSDTLIVAAGIYGVVSDFTPFTLVSDDYGETFSLHAITSLEGKRFLDMAAGLGLFVAVGQPNLIAWSSDGVTWTDVHPAGGTPDYISVTFDGTLFHAYSATTKHHSYSADGKNWTQTTFTTSAWLIDAVIYGAAQRQYSLYSIGYNALQKYNPVELIDGEILPTAHPHIGTDCNIGDVVDITDTSRSIIVSKRLTGAQTVYDDNNDGVVIPKFGENYLTLKKFIAKEIKRLA